MARPVDEYNDYGIKNPDGINTGYTDYQRVSSFNDLTNFVQETTSNNVSETQTFQETTQHRGSDYIQTTLDLTNAPDTLSDVGSQAAQEGGAAASSSGAAASTTAASTSAGAAASTTAASTAASTAAAASTTAVATVATAGATVGGAIATAVATMAVVAVVVVNAFSLAVTFLSATFNSLSFNVAIENNEENEEFRAVLYLGDDEQAIVEERKISATQIVVFDDLQEGTLYTFAVYDKDEIQKFKQTYLTSSRKDYEDQIKIDVISKENGVLTFGLFIPSVIAKDAFTLRVKDEKGNDIFAADGTEESTTYNVAIPMYRDVIISVSFGNRVVSQLKIAKAIEYKAPIYDWGAAKDGVVNVMFEAMDGSTRKVVEAPYTREVVLEPTEELNGQAKLTTTFTFEGKEYTNSMLEVIPAKLNDPSYYTFVGFEWTDNGISSLPSVVARFASATGGADYVKTIDSTIIIEDSYNEDAQTLLSTYSASYQVEDKNYSDTHSELFEEFEMYIESLSVMNYSTGAAMLTVAYKYKGLEEYGFTEMRSTSFNIGEDGIVYDLTYRGVDMVRNIDGSEDMIIMTDGGFYHINEGYQSITLSGIEDSNIEYNTFTVPDVLFNLPITTIGSSAFSDASTCYTVILGENVTSYEEYAFASSNVSTIEFTNDLTEIVKGMFANSQVSIEDVLVEGIETIGEEAFEGCTDESIVIPDSVDTIGKGAFGKMQNLTSITTSIVGGYKNGTYTDSDRPLTFFAYIFTQDDPSNWLDNASATYQAEFYPDPANLDQVERYYVANPIEYIFTGDEIPSYAFSGNNIISSITMNSVETIGSYAFYDCTSIDNIESTSPWIIPSTVDSIGDYAFAFSELGLGYSRANYYIEFENNSGALDLYLGDYLFANNDAMTSLVIPDRASHIGEGLIAGCTQLQSITIPFVGIEANYDEDDELGTIMSLFSNYASDSQAESQIMSTKTYLDDQNETQQFAVRFKQNSLTSITVTADSIPEYGFAIYYADSQNQNAILSSIIAYNVTNIGDYAFESIKVTSLSIGMDEEDDYLGTKLEHIGVSAFDTAVIGNFNLMFTSNLRYIGKGAFYQLNYNDGDFNISNALRYDTEDQDIVDSIWTINVIINGTVDSREYNKSISDVINNYCTNNVYEIIWQDEFAI